MVLGYSDGEFPPIQLRGTLTTWQLDSGKRNVYLQDVPSDAYYSAFSPDGRVLASHGALFDSATGKERVALGVPPEQLGRYAFSPTGRLIAGLIENGDGVEAIQLWEAATGRVERRFSTHWEAHLGFSPDERFLVSADREGIRLWELASGQIVLRHRAHERLVGEWGGVAFASCLSMAPDGRSVATGHPDSTAIIWTLLPSVAPASVRDLPRLWAELACDDAVGAYAASWRLVAAPAITVPFLAKRVRPPTLAPAELTARLLAELEDSEFTKRETAQAELRQLGDRAKVAFEEALKSNPSPEKRRRIEQLRRALDAPPTGAALRDLRSTAVLEHIGTPEARRVLESLSRGSPSARLTRDAKASLARLSTREASARSGYH